MTPVTCHPASGPALPLPPSPRHTLITMHSSGLSWGGLPSRRGAPCTQDLYCVLITALPPGPNTACLQKYLLSENEAGRRGSGLLSHRNTSGTQSSAC